MGVYGSPQNFPNSVHTAKKCRASSIIAARHGAADDRHVRNAKRVNPTFCQRLEEENALRVGPHKGEAPIQRDVLIIIARGKAPKKNAQSEKKKKTIQERRLPIWESALPGTWSCRKKNCRGKPRREITAGNPKRERRLPKWQPAPLGTPEM
ncbi:hypothetical protein NDU88_007017 [Pleurodeles waltl]|uniref:Uncharacterized protein n=1 Tax=Pleurodeles waltl TaxID=8319 RepID=A0AAV7WFM9_PLEWA|nr:hypothetical protein NDU88_007017 [Pleurodeles waltl]